MLAMGSSFNARPANRIPLYTCWNEGKLVMINLQKTSIDNYAEFVIYGRIQTVMTMLMEKLQIPISSFKIIRQIVLFFGPNDTTVKEAEYAGECQTFLKSQNCSYEKE